MSRAPSTASSAASTLSVRYNGKDMTLEEMIASAYKDIQGCLTQSEVQLLLLAASEDQSIDDETDFRLCAIAEAKIIDLADDLAYLVGEPPLIAAEIRDTPPSPEAKAWWVAFKAERKIAAATKTALRKQQAADDKLARKALTTSNKSGTLAGGTLERKTQ